MAAVRPLPRAGSIFFDARGDDRSLRVSWHEEADLVVVSLWRDNVCTGSFRLAGADVPGVIDTLVEVLRHRTTATPTRSPLGHVG